MDEKLQEQILDIQSKLKKAQDDDTPYAAINDSKVAVIGDANKTERKSNNYTIGFRVPITMFDSAPKDAKIVGDFYRFDIEYKDISISPRKELGIVYNITKLYPFVKKVTKDKEVKELPKEEMLEILIHSGDDVVLAMYNIVASFLDIDDVLGEYMLPFSVVSALGDIITTHPEIFNEADVFFG